MADNNIGKLEKELREAQRKRNIFKLREKLLKYQGRLVKEGERVAESRGINIVYTEEGSNTAGGDVPTLFIRKNSDGSYNPTFLIELARESCPALFRKYEETRVKYFIELRLGKPE